LYCDVAIGFFPVFFNVWWITISGLPLVKAMRFVYV
jgi:hypothetical protein